MAGSMVEMHLSHAGLVALLRRRRLALQATVATVRELKQYLADGDSNDTFIVQAFLTHFDLDGPVSQAITKRW